MEEIEKAKEEAMDKLHSIRTLEDVKEHDREIVDTLIGFLKGSVEIMRSRSKDIKALEPEKRGSEIARIKALNKQIGLDVGEELDRISSIPGAEEHMEPYMKRFWEEMPPVMAELEDINQLLEDGMKDT